MGFISNAVEAVSDAVSPLTGKPTSSDRKQAANAQQAAYDASMLAYQRQLEQNQVLTDMAQNYYKQTAPIREGTFNNLSNLLAGNYDIGDLPLYDPLRNAIESQYDVAKNNVMGSLPVGGQLNSQLANLEQQRATGLSDMMAKLLQDEYNKAYGVASNSPQVTFSGLGTAGNMYSTSQLPLAGAQNIGNYTNTQTQLANQLLSDLGQGVGFMFGTGKWGPKTG